MGQLLEHYGPWVRGLIPLCGPTPHIGLHGPGACTSPGKVPLDREWQKLPERRRGLDLLAIEQEIEEHLVGAGNVGLVVAPGVLALDADDARALAHLAAALPEAPLQKTGRGGHLIVRTDLGITNRTKVQLEPGVTVDLRGAGSQIVVYPSIHANGADYFWERPLPLDARGLPELPRRWVEPIRQTASREKKTEIVGADITDSIPAGRRNETLFALARSLRARGLPPVVVAEAVRAVNAKHCKPPLNDGELARLLRSARELANRGSA